MKKQLWVCSRTEPKTGDVITGQLCVAATLFAFQSCGKDDALLLRGHKGG